MVYTSYFGRYAMAESPTTPVSFRLNTALKERLERYTKKFSGTATDVLQISLREYLASTCPTCGAARGRIARGRTAEFAQFIKENESAAIYLRIERNGSVSVYKGRLPRLRGHHVRLSAIDPSWNQSEAQFPLDDVTDWMEGTLGDDCSEWERKNPKLLVDRSWGFTKK
jgi:hypothetical protein